MKIYTDSWHAEKTLNKDVWPKILDTGWVFTFNQVKFITEYTNVQHVIITQI